MGLLEATSSAVGDELTSLFGRRTTRVSALSGTPEEVILTSQAGATPTTATVVGTGVTFANVIDNSLIQPGDIFEVTGTFTAASGGDASRFDEDVRRAELPQLRPRKVGSGESITAAGVTVRASRESFDSGDVGSLLLVWGTTNVANSGLYTITAATEQELTITNGAAVDETSAFSWEILAPRPMDTFVVPVPSISVRIADIEPGPDFERRYLTTAEDMVTFSKELWSITTKVRRGVFLNAPTTTTANLTGLGLGENVAGAHWRIIRPAATSLTVETTLNWDAQGEFFVQGTRYRYGSKTLTTLDGLEYWEDGSWYNGLKEQYRPLMPVADWSQSWSAGDKARAGMIVTRAVGEDLGAHARRTSVTIPETASEDQIRELIQAIGYAPRGTVQSIERALNAILGIGTWELFEDNTGAGVTFADADNNPAVVYLRRETDLEQQEGKTILEDAELVPYATTTTITVPNPTATSEIVSARLAPEPARPVPSSYISGTQRRYTANRLVAYGPDATGADLAVSTDGITVEFDSDLGQRPQRGDVFQLTGGTLQGKRGIITSTSLAGAPYQITLGSLPSVPTWSLPEEQIASGTGTLRSVRWGGTADQLSNVEVVSGTFPEVTMTSNFQLRVLDNDGNEIESVPINSKPSDKTLLLDSPLSDVLGPDRAADAQPLYSWEIVDLTKRQSFPKGAPFEIWRGSSQLNQYLPSAEVILEYDGDTGTQVWDTDVTTAGRIALSLGNHTELNEDTGSTGTEERFQHYLRAGDLDGAEMSCTVAIPATGLRTSAKADGACFGLFIGGREVVVGSALDNDPSDVYGRFRFLNRSLATADTGQFISQQAEGQVVFATGGAVPTPILTVEDARGKVVTFQFTTGTVTVASYVKVDSDVSSDTGTQQADKFRTALQAQQAAGNLDVFLRRADAGGTETVLLEQEWPSVFGNGTVTNPKMDGNGENWTVTDFSGGVGPLANEARLDGSNFGYFRIVVESYDDNVVPGQRLARLYFNGTLVDEAPLNLFKAATDPSQVHFGLRDNDSLSTQILLWVALVDWSVDPMQDYLWENRLVGASGTGNTMALLTGADIGKELWIPTASAVNADGGHVEGVWEIDTATTVVGATQEPASFPDIDGGRRILASEGFPFIWPNHLGHSVQILTGVNAGTFEIVSILDPETGTDFSAETTPNSFPAGGGTTREQTVRPQVSNIVVVDNTQDGDYDSGAPLGTENVRFDPNAATARWRLVPDFPSDSGDWYITRSGSFASPTLTTAETMPSTIAFTDPVYTWTPLIALRRTRNVSGHLTPSSASNDPVGSYKPFYVWDAWGFLRPLVESLTAAGVLADFDSLIRDAAGLHIEE